MRLKYRFELVGIGENIIAVPIGDGTEHIQGIVKLNKAGLEIFELLNDDISEEQIVKHLLTKYDNNYEALRDYTRNVINTLNKYDLLEQ